MSMIYCKRCVLPNTKPGLKIYGDGICSACRSVEIKHTIDWKEREKKLHAICDQVRGSNGNGYECIVPVSGGKDSAYQAYTMSKKYNQEFCVSMLQHSDECSLGLVCSFVNKLLFCRISFGKNPLFMLYSS